MFTSSGLSCEFLDQFYIENKVVGLWRRLLPSASLVEKSLLDLFASLLAFAISPSLKAFLALSKHCKAPSLFASIRTSVGLVKD